MKVCLWIIITICYFNSSILFGYSRKISRNRDAVFTCQFDIETTGQTIARFTSDEIPHVKPQQIWSHLPQLPSISQISQPTYPTHIIVLLNDARINLQAGIIYDSSGCIGNHSFKSQDWPQRGKHLMRELMQPLHENKNEIIEYDFDEAIFIWGSYYSKDWQHAVIDFIPLFNLVLPLIIAKRNIPIIVGNYIRFFKDIFPFNITKNYVLRDFMNTQGSVTRSRCLLFKKVYVVDIINRTQSYLLPESYDRILPFLSLAYSPDRIMQNSEFNNYYKYKYNIPKDEEWLRSLEFNFTKPIAPPLNKNTTSIMLHNLGSESTNELSKDNVIVYLDRSTEHWPNSTIYKQMNKLNGRDVENREELLHAINSSLKPSYRLVVHTCLNWEDDRIVLANAKVILGPHGGHFTNMIFAPRGAHVIEFGRGSILRQFYEKSEKRSMNNARWVFAGLSNALGMSSHWFIEDMKAVDTVRRGHMPRWSDGKMKIDCKQVVDTLRKIGVAY